MKIICSDYLKFLFILLALLTIAMPVSAENADFRLQLLHSSDNESSFQDPNTLEPKILHYATVLAGLRELARKENIPSLYVTAGDHSLPGPFYDAAAAVRSLGSPGTGDIEIFNATGLAANGMGNHEFDGGIADFARMIHRASYPFIAVNLDFSNTRVPDGIPPVRIGKDGGSIQENAGKVVRSAYAEIGGEKIGLIGRAPADFFNVVRDPAETLPGTDFCGGRNPENNQPLVSAAIQVAEQVRLLESIGINKIILLDHSQDYTEDPLYSKSLKGIDIVVMAGATGFMSRPKSAGPFNLLRREDRQEGNYPDIREDSEGKTLVVVNTDQQYRYVGNLILTFDREGHIREIDPRSGPVAASPEGVAALEKELAQPLSVPAPVQAVFDELKNTEMIQEQFRIVGSTDKPLNGLREDVRSRETNLGRLTALSALRYAQQVGKVPDAALKNGGGIRNSVPGPHITKMAIAAALPFDNKMAVVELSGAELLAVMENAVSRHPHKDGRFPQVAGMSIIFDPEKPGLSDQIRLEKASRIKELRVFRTDGKEEVLVENFVIKGEADRTFRLVTNDFLLTGGDGYHALKAAASRGKEILDIREQDMLEKYIREDCRGKVNLPDPPEKQWIMSM